MENREKQIAGMEAVLFNYQSNVCGSCGSEQTCKNLGYGECGIFQSMATDLYEAGYRKMEEVTLHIDLGDRTPEEIQDIMEKFSKAAETSCVAVPNNNEEQIRNDTAMDILSTIYFDPQIKITPELTATIDKLADKYTRKDKKGATVSTLNGFIEQTRKQVAKEIYDLIDFMPIPNKHGTHLHIGFENGLSAAKLKISQKFNLEVGE